MTQEQFDAYHELLGIPPNEQPPNHYRLLGISLFETRLEVISNMATRQTNYVRQAGGSAYSDASQRLLNEIAAAKLCLLDPDKKADYDGPLRESLSRPAKSLEQTEWQPVRYHANRVTPNSWVIGRSSGCDIVLNESTLSRLHCVLEATSQGLFVVDRGSGNGVFVNGEMTPNRRQVELTDNVTLGKRVVLPWPAAVFGLGRKIREVSVGRSVENDMVIDSATISATHLRLLELEKGIVVQDLGSANGTAFGAVDKKFLCARVPLEGVLYLGSHAIPVDQIV